MFYFLKQKPKKKKRKIENKTTQEEEKAKKEKISNEKPVIIRKDLVIKDGFILCYFAAHCYKRVMDETKQMQEKIIDKLGLSPDDKSVVVLYDGERDKVYANSE